MSVRGSAGKTVVVYELRLTVRRRQRLTAGQLVVIYGLRVIISMT